MYILEPAADSQSTHFFRQLDFSSDPGVANEIFENDQVAFWAKYQAED